jgi:hypothetical protein
MPLPKIVDSNGWTARQKAKVTPIDVLLCAAYPFGIAGFVLFAGIIHSDLGRWAWPLFIVGIALTALILTLPILTILWILFNRGKTAESMLWLESSLVGVWGGLLLTSSVSDRLQLYDWRFLVFALGVAIPIILTPHYSRNRRPPKTT